MHSSKDPPYPKTICTLFITIATINIKKLKNRPPTSVVTYAFMDQRSPNLCAIASTSLGLVGGAFYLILTWCLKAVPTMVTQQ